MAATSERCKTCKRCLGLADEDSSEVCVDCYICEGCWKRLIWHVEDPPIRNRCWNCLSKPTSDDPEE